VDLGRAALKKDFAGQYRDLVQWHWWFRGRQQILRSLLQRTLDDAKPRSIAVLGSGPAEGVRWVSTIAVPRARIVAVDIDVDHARGANSFLDFIVGSAEAVPLRSRSFDLVLALDVMEHLDDDARGLDESARLLKKDGLLVVTVPALPSLWGAQDVVSNHRRRYTKRSLQDLFLRSRLPSPRITYFNTFLFPPIAAVRWARRLTGGSDDSRSDFEGSHEGAVNDILATIFAVERVFVGTIGLPIGASLLALWKKTDAT
jgi:SAM-dependent methyltransferase